MNYLTHILNLNYLSIPVAFICFLEKFYPSFDPQTKIITRPQIKMNPFQLRKQITYTPKLILPLKVPKG